jgi:hypothetical protein
MKIEAELSAEDEAGNKINVQVLFYSRSNQVPKLQINELRTEYSKPKAEFIELKMLSDGNLGALRVFVSSNKNPMIYQFLPVEVKEEEYVVLHLRKLDDSSTDEFGENLGESGGIDSSLTARDFWIPSSSKLLHRTDAVYVLDQDDNVLDAVMISETPDASWGNDYLLKAAEFLFDKEAWKSVSGGICTPADAVTSAGMTATRSISRDETKKNTGTAADWYITATSGSSPGAPNK